MWRRGVTLLTHRISILVPLLILTLYMLANNCPSSEKPHRSTVNRIATTHIYISCEAVTSSGCCNCYGSKGGSQAKTYKKQQVCIGWRSGTDSCKTFTPVQQPVISYVTYIIFFLT